MKGSSNFRPLNRVLSVRPVSLRASLYPPHDKRARMERKLPKAGMAAPASEGYLWGTGPI